MLYHAQAGPSVRERIVKGGSEENRANGLEVEDSEILSALASNAGDQAEIRRRHDTWQCLT